MTVDHVGDTSGVHIKRSALSIYPLESTIISEVNHRKL